MFRGYRAGLIDFSEQDVEVNPYLLGVWLGDGLHRELMITSADCEIVEWLSAFAKEKGVKLTCGGKIGNKAKDYRLSKIAGKHGRTNPIWDGFKNIGVVSNKHIPDRYIANSEIIRLELLAGLIDADGHAARNGYRVGLANERLARDIKRLADTLGFRTSLIERKTICGNNGKQGKAWYIGINGDTWKIPCRIKRKQHRYEDARPNKDKLLSQITVTPIGEGEYFGFSVDDDHLFCLGDGTVTHNSWNVARLLLLRAYQQNVRILCAREFQNSIDDSVYRLLRDQIDLLGLTAQFRAIKNSIQCLRTGSEFLFKGLQRNINEIKSLEGVDICWVEEAQRVSADNWDILIPTIRKEGSEIWLTFNPNEATDPTYQRFVVNPPPGAVVVKVGYRDNPWFPQTLQAERLHCRATDMDAYRHIWDGETRVRSAAEVFQGKWSISRFEAPSDARFYFGADWGFSQDPTVLVRCWISEYTLYIDYEAWGVGVEIDETPALFRRVPGVDRWPIKADSARPETISAMRRAGFNITAARKWPGCVEDGIAVLRGFQQIVIHERCKHAQDEMKLYRYKTDKLTGEVLPLLASGNDHICDALRYSLDGVIKRGGDGAMTLQVAGL